jgi:hypothetical protein
MKQETAQSIIAKGSVPTAVSGAILWGYPLQDWVLVLTAIWVILQIGGYIYDRWKKHVSGG